MNIRPQKGMQEYLPSEARLRDSLMEIILKTYTQSGFERIYTPCVESAENLDKSDGGDNLNLIFKIMKRGEKLEEAIKNGGELSDLGLRYDLTLPLSRFYANNRNSLPTPFKVIQADKVYRAERPQRGRLREFMQCDIDILGSKSPCCEVELIAVTAQALSRIGINEFRVRVNDRRILRDCLITMGFPEESCESVAVTFDKLDKIGTGGIAEELREKNMPETAVKKLTEMLSEKITLEKMSEYCSENAGEAIAGLKWIIDTANGISEEYSVDFDPSLVRGQGYYTGTVFEVESRRFGGTVAGGGRYDGLIGRFIGGEVPAVGFSIGFERIYLLLKENGIDLSKDTKRIAVIYKENEVLSALEKSKELKASENTAVTLIAAENPKKADKLYTKAKQQGFDEIIKLNL